MAPKSNSAAVLIPLPLCLTNLSEPIGLGPIYKIQLNLHAVL